MTRSRHPSISALAATLAAVAVHVASPGAALAAAAEAEGASPHWGRVFLMFALVLMAGKIGDVVERVGQPAVIGELLAGIVLATFGYLGWGLMIEITENASISFLSSLGALILLFSIGLESNLTDMRRVGGSALLVASIGVAVPFVLGTYVLGPMFFPDESSNALLFLGAALVATSVGITASAFRSMGITRSRAAQTVLGAAVIDDVLGLIVLAVVSALAEGNGVSGTMVAELALKAFGFLAAALLLGSLAAGALSRVFSYVSTGVSMKLAVALSLALGLGYLAELFGLEAIIGAFAAGLILEAVHFKWYADPGFVRDLGSIRFEAVADRARVNAIVRRHQHSHVEDLISNLSMVFVPIFFVYTGMQIDIGSLLKPDLYLAAILISLAAIGGKVIAGVAARGSVTERLLVGVSMVPRGEVGLIFAATGKGLGVLTEDMFSVIILVVIITTFVAPPVINRIAARVPDASARSRVLEADRANGELAL